MNVVCYQYNVEFLVRKGLGPDWVTKIVFQAYDDVDPDVAEYIVKQWAIADAKQYLKDHDCPAFVFIEIYNA